MSHVEVLAHANRLLKALSDYVDDHPVEAAINGAYGSSAGDDWVSGGAAGSADEEEGTRTKGGFPQVAKSGAIRKERDSGDDADDAAPDATTSEAEDQENEEAQKEFKQIPNGNQTETKEVTKAAKVKAEPSDKAAASGSASGSGAKSDEEAAVAE